MKVLIACEESQTVCKAFRAKGHEAYSADIQDCSGGHPEWHIKGDVLPIINGNADFVTMDGTAHRIEGTWDLIIAHPPCTYLTNVATRHYSLKCTPAERVVERMEHREEAIVFFYAVHISRCAKDCCRKSYWSYWQSVPQGRSGHTPIYVFRRRKRYRTVCYQSNVPVAQRTAETTGNIYRR